MVSCRGNREEIPSRSAQRLRWRGFSIVSEEMRERSDGRRSPVLEESEGSAGKPGLQSASGPSLLLASTEMEAKERAGSPEGLLRTLAKHQLIQRQAYTSGMAREEELPGELPSPPAGCWGRDGEAREKGVPSGMNGMVVRHWSCPKHLARL